MFHLISQWVCVGDKNVLQECLLREWGINWFKRSVMNTFFCWEDKLINRNWQRGKSNVTYWDKHILRSQTLNTFFITVFLTFTLLSSETHVSLTIYIRLIFKVKDSSEFYSIKKWVLERDCTWDFSLVQISSFEKTWTLG